jgi:hypothetical protein
MLKVTSPKDNSILGNVGSIQKEECKDMLSKGGEGALLLKIV